MRLINRYLVREIVPYVLLTLVLLTSVIFLREASRFSELFFVFTRSGTPTGPLSPICRSRGMHLWYDLVDWIGGYPFEVAKPEEVFRFVRDRGFQLVEMTTCGGNLGCNEFVFRRTGT